MITVPLFLSEKIPGREKVISLLTDELKLHIFAFSAAVIGAEVFMLVSETPEGFSRGLFAAAFLGFFCFFAVLSRTIGLHVGNKAAETAALISAVVFLYILRRAGAWPFLSTAVLLAAGTRAVFIFLPDKDKVVLFGSFALDAAALFLCFGEHVLGGSFPTDKLLFAGLAVLTLAALQKILAAWGKEAFPFLFFALAGALLVSLPMSRKPIDWTPVVRAGANLVDTMADAADNAAYYFSSFFDGESYEAGYSSLDASGESLAGSEKTEITLETAELPFYIYKDEENGKSMRVRRVLYLAGGRGADRARFVRFLHFLHENGVDRNRAALFSRISTVDVTYTYLDTPDEIAPANAFLLTTKGGRIENGSGRVRHKKGYELSARYLDIDYGSPYLAELLVENEPPSAGQTLSYKEFSKYAQELYSIRFANIMSREEYEEACSAGISDKYLAVLESSERMEELAAAITEGAQSDYERCRRIETYLRQYAYNKQAAGGHDPDSNMSTAAGMMDIADRFLFETQNGYCVHYTSAMVMLLRLSGIPARAAVGYRYVFPFEKEDAYEVDGSCAHAWPEGYIAGIGWVPFEPTASCKTAADFTWHKTAPGVKARETLPEEAEVPELPEAQELAGPENTRETARQVFGALRPVLLFMGVLILGVIAAVLCAGRLRYHLAAPEKRLYMDVAMIKRSIRRQAGEDFPDRGLLSDYTERAPEALRGDVRKVFDSYYRIVYGNGEPHVEFSENELARTVREQLVRGAKVDER